MGLLTFASFPLFVTLLEPAIFRERPRPIAWVAALLWSLHPLQTEAVTYIIQRAESMMGMFCLVALYCGIRATEGRRSAGWTGPWWQPPGAAPMRRITRC